MKKQIKVWFEWSSKHWILLKWIIGAIFTLIAIYVWPLLLIKVLVPVWVIFLIVIIPIIFYYHLSTYMIERKTPKKFDNGDKVYLKGTYKTLYIVSYDWLSHTIVDCTEETCKRFTYHQNSLEHQENPENHSSLFLSGRRNDMNRY